MTKPGVKMSMSDQAGAFVKEGNLKGSPIGNVDMWAVGAGQVALALLIALRGKANTAAKEAEEYCVACACLGVALDGVVGGRDALPICWRRPDEFLQGGRW
mmetsp:Transcript_19615/g.54040  ORF Transcript_19615/g.54040 Transcript_19615/m.54040 type:complete len:101 (-) Transcript_19615:364-666(-)